MHIDITSRRFLALVCVAGFLAYSSVVVIAVYAAPPTRQFPTEATPEDKTAADLQRVSSRTNDLGEQVDGVGLALVETEDQLRDEIRKLRDELTEVQREMTQIRDEHAKLWILMHSPPVVQGEANPVREFMEAKRPEVFAYSPWFACPFCVQHKAWFEKNAAPFDLHWSEIESAEDAKDKKIPDNAGYPVYQMTDKNGKWWFFWNTTPQGLIAEFERRNK